MRSMPKTIIIIGAGVAGLAAGCYGQMNGYNTQIFELHDLPGGLCTAWERKGYIFDGCIHYLFGSAPGKPFNKMWKELGAVQNRQMIHHSEFMRVISPQGVTLIAYCDPDRFAQHLKEISPQDSDLIEDLAEGISQFAEFDMSILQEKPLSQMSPDDWLAFSKAVLPYALPLAKWGMKSSSDLAQGFKHPFLRQAIPHMFGWPEIPVMAGLALLAYMHQGNAGFPAGASLEFARAIERRYLELGGCIHYKAQVQKILVEDDRAIGVRLYDDSEHFADYVISAADGYSTIFTMLEGKYTSKKIDGYYDGSLPIHSQIQVSLGVNRDFSDQPHWVTHLLPEPITIAGEDHHQIGVKHYCFDPSLAPPGKSVVEVMLSSRYSYWQRIYGRKPYDMEQIQVEDIVIDYLERLYPGIRDQIEVVDVATPLSYERYTGNWMGSTCGWLLTKDTMLMMIQGIDKTLPDLENFYMAGQWVEPGGSVPTAAMSGRNAIQLICHKDDSTFVTQE